MKTALGRFSLLFTSLISLVILLVTPGIARCQSIQFQNLTGTAEPAPVDPNRYERVSPLTGKTIVANVDLYQRVEQTLTNTTAFRNPFTETELRLEVTAPADRPRGASFTWYGFHDGDGAGGQNGNVWKFRLLFDHPGLWTVKAGFYIPGTSTANGPSQIYTYDVAFTKQVGEHGHLRVDPSNPRRLRHDDGTPWVPFVVQSSMLLERDLALTKLWIDRHVALGVDALAVRFHAESYILGDPYRVHFLKNGSDWDYDRYDIATWHHNEQIIEYAQSKGVKLSIWFGISGLNPQYASYGPHDYPNDTTLGPQQKAFIKYFLARWAPYTNFWHWTVDSEYEETGPGALERNRTYAAELRAKNPWGTLVTTHVLADWSPGNSPEFDLATLQRRVPDTDEGATSCRTFITDNDDYGIPVYNSEGVWRLSHVTRSRVATWTHLMAGGFSMIAHDGTNGTHQTSSWGVSWNEVNPRHKEDAVEIGKMAKFFNHTPGIDINPCVPHHQFVTLSGGNLAFCLAAPGQSYYIWLDRGGAPSLDLTGVTGKFSVTRYRCTDLSKPDTLASISGGGVRQLEATLASGFNNDYLYVVKRTVEIPPITVIDPNGKEKWSAGGTAAVSWSAKDTIANVNITLSADGGSTYPLILAANSPNDGHQIVTVPQTITSRARVRVSNASDSSTFDASDADFIITTAPDTTSPVVIITSPLSNGKTLKGEIKISGTAKDDAGIVMVEWQLDSTTGSWNIASGTNAWSFSVPQPKDGSHTVYVRATDAATPANTSTPVIRTFVADNTGPQISNVRAKAGRTTATITWETPEVSDSRVQWGTAANHYTNDTGIVEAGVTQHSVTLHQLTPATIYHYIVASRDSVGNLSISADSTFQTLARKDSILYGTFTWRSDPHTGANTFDEAIITIVAAELNPTQFQVQATVDLLFGAGDDDYMVNPYVRLNDDKQYIFLGRVGGQSVDLAGGKIVPYATPLIFNKPDSGAWYLGYENYFDNSHLPETNHGAEESGPLSKNGGSPDTTAPVISNVAVSEVTTTSASITWNTNEAANSQVEYGTSTNYGQNSTLNVALVTSHAIELSNLSPTTTYHFRVKSRDAANNLAVSEDFTFTTRSGGGDQTMTVTDNFNRSEIGPDWTLEPQYWEIKNGEFGHTEAATGSWRYLAVYNPVSNGNGRKIIEVSHRWGQNVDALGVREGAMALMLDADSPHANGYWIWHRYGQVWLWTIVNGEYEGGLDLGRWDGLPDPVAGDEITIKIRQEPDANYFDYYINGNYSATAVDPNKLFPKSDTWYTGFFLRGENLHNEVDDFSLTYIESGLSKPAAELIPTTFALHNYPNPFNAVTRIRVDLPQNAEIDLAVFDLAGRQVQELMATAFPAGSHEILWESRNRHGRKLSSGIYLLRLRYRSEKTNSWAQIVRRVMRLR